MSDMSLPYRKRLFCALTLLQIYASLRYADTKKVSHIFATKTALCGVSVDPKSNNGDIMQRAAPLGGISGVDWWPTVLKHWEGIKPQESNTFVPLYRRVDKNWLCCTKKAATLGSTKAALSRLEQSFGLNTHFRIHPPRSWCATIARQLLYSREDREKLGLWAPGSLMPELYDRATCATELRLRDEILTKIKEGFVPAGPFELAKKAGAEIKAESSDATSTSVLSTSEGGPLKSISLIYRTFSIAKKQRR